MSTAAASSSIAAGMSTGLAGSLTLVVQYGAEAAELSMPVRTTFAQLHVLLLAHWPAAVAAGPTRLLDADGHQFPPQELVQAWVPQLPDGVVYLVAEDDDGMEFVDQAAAATAVASLQQHSLASPTVAALLAYAPGAVAVDAAQTARAPVAASPVRRATAITASSSPVRRAPGSATARASVSAKRTAGAVASSAVSKRTAPSSATKATPVSNGSAKQARATPSSSASVPPQPSTVGSPTPVTPSGRSFPNAHLESALWRVFSAYSLTGPHGNPDALSSQLFFRLLSDCGLANKAITRGGGAGASSSLPTPASAAAAEMSASQSSTPASPAATLLSPCSQQQQLHAPPPPCTPLRRSDAELIYINALKLVLPSTSAGPPLSAATSQSPMSPSSARSPSSASPTEPPTKMNFELFVHALLAVAQLFYGEAATASAAVPSSSSKLPRSSNKGVWDTPAQSLLLQRLVVEHVLPSARRWDVREVVAAHKLVEQDEELARVRAAIEAPLLQLFRRYAEVTENQAARLGWTSTSSTKTEQSHARSASSSGSASASVAGSSSAAPVSVSSYLPPLLLSWSQWQAFCADFRFAKLMLTAQDTSKLFVQGGLERMVREHQLQQQQTSSVSAPATAGLACADFCGALFLNPSRLSLSAPEFLLAFTRAALLSLSKMGLEVPPSFMLKAFLAHVQHGGTAIGASANATAAGSAGAGPSTSMGPSSSGSGSGPRTAASAALYASTLKAVSRLRETYVSLWRADGSVNYFDAAAVRSRIESVAAARRSAGEAVSAASVSTDAWQPQLPEDDGPTSAADWVSALQGSGDASASSPSSSFRALCTRVAHEHDPHRLVLAPTTTAKNAAASGATAAAPAASPKAKQQAQLSSSPSSSPVRAASARASKSKTRPVSAAKPSNGKGAAAAASPAASELASFEHLMLFPRALARAQAALSPQPAPLSAEEKRERAVSAAKQQQQQRRGRDRAAKGQHQEQEQGDANGSQSAAVSSKAKLSAMLDAYSAALNNSAAAAAAANGAAMPMSPSPPPAASKKRQSGGGASLATKPRASLGRSTSPQKKPVPPSSARAVVSLKEAVQQPPAPRASSSSRAASQPRSASPSSSSAAAAVAVDDSCSAPRALTRTPSPAPPARSASPQHSSRPASPRLTAPSYASLAATAPDAALASLDQPLRADSPAAAEHAAASGVLAPRRVSSRPATPLGSSGRLTPVVAKPVQQQHQRRLSNRSPSPLAATVERAASPRDPVPGGASITRPVAAEPSSTSLRARTRTPSPASLTAAASTGERKSATSSRRPSRGASGGVSLDVGDEDFDAMFDRIAEDTMADDLFAPIPQDNAASVMRRTPSPKSKGRDSPAIAEAAAARLSPVPVAVVPAAAAAAAAPSSTSRTGSRRPSASQQPLPQSNRGSRRGSAAATPPPRQHSSQLDSSQPIAAASAAPAPSTPSPKGGRRSASLAALHPTQSSFATGHDSLALDDSLLASPPAGADDLSFRSPSSAGGGGAVDFADATFDDTGLFDSPAKPVIAAAAMQSAGRRSRPASPALMGNLPPIGSSPARRPIADGDEPGASSAGHSPVASSVKRADSPQSQKGRKRLGSFGPQPVEHTAADVASCNVSQVDRSVEAATPDVPSSSDAIASNEAAATASSTSPSKPIAKPDDSYQDDSYDEQFLSESMEDPRVAEQQAAAPAAPADANPAPLGSLPPLFTGAPASSPPNQAAASGTVLAQRTSSFDHGFSSPPVGGEVANFSEEDFTVIGSGATPKQQQMYDMALPSPSMSAASASAASAHPASNLALPTSGMVAAATDLEQAERERRAAEEIAASKAALGAAGSFRCSGPVGTDNSAQALLEKVRKGALWTSWKAGVFGGPKASPRFLRVEGSKLCYGPTANSAGKSVTLDSLRELRLGTRGSKALAKVSGEQVERALTIVAHTKTFELVAQTQQQCDEWVNFLANYVPAKRAFRP